MSEAAALMPDRSDSPENLGVPKNQVLMHDHPVLGTYRLPRDSGASWKRYFLEACVVSPAPLRPGISVELCPSQVSLVALAALFSKSWSSRAAHQLSRLHEQFQQ